MSVLSTCTYVHCMYAWCPPRMLDPLELELYVVVSYRMDVGIQTQVLRKETGNKYEPPQWNVFIVLRGRDMCHSMNGGQRTCAQVSLLLYQGSRADSCLHIAGVGGSTWLGELCSLPKLKVCNGYFSHGFTQWMWSVCACVSPRSTSDAFLPLYTEAGSLVMNPKLAVY